MNGNEIFKTLLEEANKENERQAGKIIGKIIAEAKEEVMRLARVKTINDMSFETWKRVYKYY